MSSVNGKFEVVADVAAATATALVITWTANTPTAGATQTIADGDLVAGTELGQAIQNINTVVTALVADVAAMRTAQNNA
jgi:hypothetical protein